MEQIELAAEGRQISGKEVKQLRRQGLVPAVLYGHRQEPLTIQIQERSLSRILSRAGTHHLINLKIDGEVTKSVLVKEIQRHPIKGGLLHVDLYAVVMSEKIRTRVPLVFTGSSPVAIRKEGILVHGLNEIEIQCLPTDLIGSISVTLDRLTEINQSILVQDLVIDPGIEILTGKDEMVAKVLPMVEEKIEEVVPAAPAEVEVIAKGKEEEEETAPAPEEEKEG